MKTKIAALLLALLTPTLMGVVVKGGGGGAEKCRTAKFTFGSSQAVTTSPTQLTTSGWTEIRDDGDNWTPNVGEASLLYSGTDRPEDMWYQLTAIGYCSASCGASEYVSLYVGQTNTGVPITGWGTARGTFGTSDSGSQFLETAWWIEGLNQPSGGIRDGARFGFGIAGGSTHTIAIEIAYLTIWEDDENCHR